MYLQYTPISGGSPTTTLAQFLTSSSLSTPLIPPIDHELQRPHALKETDGISSYPHHDDQYSAADAEAVLPLPEARVASR